MADHPSHMWAPDAQLHDALLDDESMGSSGSENEYEEVARGTVPATASLKRRAGSSGDGRRVRRRAPAAAFEKEVASTVKIEAERRIKASSKIWLTPHKWTTIEWLLCRMKKTGETRPVRVWSDAFGDMTLVAKIRPGEKSYVNAGGIIGVHLEKPADPSPQLSSDPGKILLRWVGEMFDAVQPKVAARDFLAECLRKLDVAVATKPSEEEMAATIGNPAAGMTQADVIAMLGPDVPDPKLAAVKKVVSKPPAVVVPLPTPAPPFSESKPLAMIPPPAAVVPLSTPAPLTLDDLMGPPEPVNTPPQNNAVFATVSLLLSTLSNATNQQAVHEFLESMTAMFKAAGKLA